MLTHNFFARPLSDWLTEFVDQVRAVISAGNLFPQTKEHRWQITEASHPLPLEMKSTTGERLGTLTPNSPEPWFIKMVEDCLRKFPDTIALGQSPLIEYVGVGGESQIARGKQLQRLLKQAIEALRPAGSRPVGALPRDWYNYVVVHDAYVKGVRNRELMIRLHISEGTFNRTRRTAVRGVATWLIEGTRQRSNNS